MRILLTSLNESHITLVNQSLYSSVEIMGTKSLKGCIFNKKNLILDVEHQSCKYTYD